MQEPWLLHTSPDACRGRYIRRRGQRHCVAVKGARRYRRVHENWDEKDEHGTLADQDWQDVQICQVLNITAMLPILGYKEREFSAFLSSMQGTNTQPDVLCNPEIKFKAFLDFAEN